MLTKNIDIDFDQLKTFSILSEMPQFAEFSTGDRYVSYIGYIFNYSTFSTLLMWAVCGPTLYQNVWKENIKSVENIKSLNKHDDSIQLMNTDQIIYHFYSKIKNSLNNMDVDDLEKLLNQMFESGHYNSTN